MRQQLSHSNSRCGALMVSLSISPSDHRDDDSGEDDQGESDKHPEKGKCFWSTSSKYHICQTSPCVDMTQWCAIFLLKRGRFIWNSKEEGSHYGSLLDKQWPTWRAEWQERKKTRPKNVGTAFAEIFGTGAQCRAKHVVAWSLKLPLSSKRSCSDITHFWDELLACDFSAQICSNLMFSLCLWAISLASC